jgi:DNA-binding response OmpR family regulator
VNPYESKILLISKNKTALSFALNFMGKQGYQVDGANDYISALKKIHRTGFDLVIFLDEMEEKEKDYIKNIGKTLRSDLSFIYYTDPIQHLPVCINRMIQFGE